MNPTTFQFLPDTPLTALHRSLPWAETPLGPPDTWPTPLRTLLPVMLVSNQPMFIVWGASRTLLYNDAYAEILANKHPRALGCDFLEVWHEIRDSLSPIVAAAYDGRPVQMADIELWMERRGYREEAHFSFSYSPLRGDTGDVDGFLCACLEITAQVLAERRLAESEARHRGVLENMEEGFVLFDHEFTMLEVNAAAMRMVGLSREAMIGRNHWQLFPGTFEGLIGQMYRQVAASQRPQQLQHLYRFPDGRARWYDLRAFPVADGLAAVFRDVTERKTLEQEAATSLERIELALDAGAIVGTWVWHIQENVFIADERFAVSFGLDPARLKVGAPLEYAIGAIHPDDRVRVQEVMERALQERARYCCEYRVLRLGEYRWVQASGRVEVNDLNLPARFPGVLLDIHEHRRVEDERDRASALLHTFIEAVPGVVFAKDREGRYLIANRGAAETLGLSRNEIIGRTDAEVIRDPAEASAVMARDRDIVASGVPLQLEEIVTRADGTPAVWWSTKEPLRAADGEVIGLVGASVDITERKRLEEALRLSNQRKDEFLAMLAHELRNPLAPIRTSSHLLQLSSDDPHRVRTAGNIIARQVGHLTQLVDDLLDVSRVTRGLVELVKAPVDLRAVVSTAVEQARPLIQTRRHILTTHIGAGPFTVQGDFHRLVQVVSNLLNNAAKYTPPEGRIDVLLDIEDRQAVLAVTDTGVGIDSHMREHMFELFTQAERTPDRSQGGLGIGLALVRSLVHLHDGDVRADSRGLHQGSTFRVVLPLSDRSTVTVADEALPAPTDPGRVLIVDDNVDAAMTLSDVLQVIGHWVDTAHDARSALDKARAGVWDAVVLDIGLPDMTGYELAERLRDTEAAGNATYIALTGYGQAGDRERSKASGFDHHLVKPADIAELADIIGRAARSRRPRHAPVDR